MGLAKVPQTIDIGEGENYETFRKYLEATAMEWDIVSSPTWDWVIHQERCVQQHRKVELHEAIPSLGLTQQEMDIHVLIKCKT
jgi:hypothetical protein